MIRFQKNRDIAAARWKGRICPKIKKIIWKHIENVVTCIPIKPDKFNYQVRCHDGSQVCVNLEQHTCSCRIWDLSGIPCKHAISAITHQRGDFEDYINEWYTVECNKKSYAPSIKGINGAGLRAKTSFIPPLPPNMGRGKERPAAARRNEPDEPQRKSKKKGRGRRPTRLKRRQVTLTCTNCGYEGHNSKSCGRVAQVKTQTSGSQFGVGAIEEDDVIPLKNIMKKEEMWQERAWVRTQLLLL